MDNFDILGQGQIAAAGGDFYLVPASKHVAIKYISLIVVSASSPKIDMYINDNTGAVANLWRHVELSGLYDSWEWDGSLLMGTGDRLWGKADTTLVCNFLVSGVVGDPV